MQKQTWGTPTAESYPAAEQRQHRHKGVLWEDDAQKIEKRASKRASKGRSQVEIKEDEDKSKPQQKVNSHTELVKITYFHHN